MTGRAVAAVAAVAVSVTACSSSPSKDAGTGSKTDVAAAGCSSDSAAKKVSLPAKFPADFPLPPGTVVTSVDDRGSGGVVVAGVTATAFKTVLRSLQKQLPARGFTPKDGETEPHDAESDWTSSDYEGRWAIREIPQCAGDTAVSVVARRR